MKVRLAFFSVATLTTLCGAVLFASTPVAALYNTWPYTKIAQGLPNGIQSAVNWDGGCRNYLNPARGQGTSYMNTTFNSNGSGTLRKGINGGASYVGTTWLSAAGSGNTVTPILVKTSDSSVGLRINDLVFLCGPLVHKDLAGLPDFTCRQNISGSDIVNDSSRWVTNNRLPNDQLPNPLSGGCMYPTRAYQVTKIMSLQVETAPAFPGDKSFYYSGTTAWRSGSTINTFRDDNSRYWFGNPLVPVTFSPTGGKFTKSGWIHLRMTFKKYSGYYNTDYQSSIKNCEAGNIQGVGRTNQWPNSDAFVSACADQTNDLLVQINFAQNYTLVPALTVTPPVLTPNNTNVSIAGLVKNTGTTATSGGVDWQINRFVVAPGQNYGTNNGYNNPCSEYTNYKLNSCQLVKKGNRDFPITPVSTTNLTGAGLGDSVGALPYGSKVCYFLSVKPFDDSIAEWAHSTPACSVVGKQPIAVVQGNDLRVGSALALGSNLPSIIQGSTLLKAGGTYGPWVEYGITAPGAVASIGSGSAFAPASGGPNNPSQWSPLTFANAMGSFGGYVPRANLGALGALPDIGKYFQFSTPASVTKKNVGDITLGAYEPNTVYISSGVVTISSNLSAPGAISDISKLSQMVIIAAGGVRISQNVTNVDSWLIAPNGTVDTCYEQQGALTTNLCNKQLTINGPVQAKSLQLRRTSGDEKTPAEAMNLRSDAYLWAHQVSASNGSWQTKYTTELPPRY